VSDERLLKAGYRGVGIVTPTFEVNGMMRSDSPSPVTILKHLWRSNAGPRLTARGTMH